MQSAHLASDPFSLLRRFSRLAPSCLDFSFENCHLNAQGPGVRFGLLPGPVRNAH